MKKIYFSMFFIMIFLSMPVQAAQSLKVSALTPFNSLNPVETMKVITLERAEFKNGMVFEEGTVITGDIFDVKQPKRAKLNASFKFKPTSYLYNGRVGKIEDPNFVAKYAELKSLDKAALATSAATTAGGIIFQIPLLSQGVSLVKGMWKNPENNRLKSGVVQVYKDSPLSYIEEGKDIVINRDTMFVLKFKSSDAEDLDALEETHAVDDNNQTSVQQSTSEPSSVRIQTQFSLNANTTDVHNTEVKHIETVSPEDVLKEVELNTK